MIQNGLASATSTFNSLFWVIHKPLLQTSHKRIPARKGVGIESKSCWSLEARCNSALLLLIPTMSCTSHLNMANPVRCILRLSGTAEIANTLEQMRGIFPGRLERSAFPIALRLSLFSLVVLPDAWCVAIMSGCRRCRPRGDGGSLGRPGNPDSPDQCPRRPDQDGNQVPGECGAQQSGADTSTHLCQGPSQYPETYLALPC